MFLARVAAALSTPFHAKLEAIARSMVAEADVDLFLRPAGEPALVGPDSVSWRVFKNPVSMFVGGVAGVLLELAEPRVRTAVWEHSSFPADPARRLRRTGLAAMVTVYGGRSRIEALAAQVRRMHGGIAGVTAAGKTYRADDPELLRWVQTTAAWAFLAAYRQHVAPITVTDGDLYFAEGIEGSALYGAFDGPRSEADYATFLAGMRPRLEPSPILHELLRLVRSAPILPATLRPVQALMVRAAVDLLPRWARVQLRLQRYGRLSAPERAFLRAAGGAADHIVLPSSPAVQACLRLGLPAEYLYRR